VKIPTSHSGRQRHRSVIATMTPTVIRTTVRKLARTQRQHEEEDDASRAHPGECRIAELRDEIQIDEVVHRLDGHSDGDGQRHGEDVARQRAAGQISHGVR